MLSPVNSSVSSSLPWQLNSSDYHAYHSTNAKTEGGRSANSYAADPTMSAAAAPATSSASLYSQHQNHQQQHQQQQQQYGAYSSSSITPPPVQSSFSSSSSFSTSRHRYTAPTPRAVPLPVSSASNIDRIRYEPAEIVAERFQIIREKLARDYHASMNGSFSSSSSSSSSSDASSLGSIQKRSHSQAAAAAVLERVEKMMKADQEENSAEAQAAKALRQRIAQLLELRQTPLPEGDLQRAAAVLNGPDTLEILTDKFNFQVSRNNMKRLNRGQWLNDELINFYMELLKQRDAILCGQDPDRKPSWFFHSLFIAKMLENENDTPTYKYSRVRRWTKKVDVFSKEKLFFPINLYNSHWVLAVVNFKTKEIVFYDSMSGSGMRHLRSIMQWLVDEAVDKGKPPINPEEWTLIDHPPNVPQQKNGIDCGVFTCVCSDFLADDLPLSYSQENIPYWRNKIACDILRGNILY